MTLQSILNKRVRAAGGQCIGRVYDFGARREGEEILITHLCVGKAAWIGRLRLGGFWRRAFSSKPELKIPWEAIESADGEVLLKTQWNRQRCEQCQPAPEGAG